MRKLGLILIVLWVAVLAMPPASATPRFKGSGLVSDPARVDFGGVSLRCADRGTCPRVTVKITNTGTTTFRWSGTSACTRIVEDSCEGSAWGGFFPRPCVGRDLAPGESCRIDLLGHPNRYDDSHQLGAIHGMLAVWERTTYDGDGETITFIVPVKIISTR
jgi:hypothetical protein